MGKNSERIKMARPGEAEAVRTTIVGGRPPARGVSVGDIPRGVEILIKKAAVDPAFKKLLFEKRAEAAEAIALKLEPAEAAMLAAVPEAQLRAIVASTKVSPNLRPAFLGYAAAAMLAALGAAAYAEDPDEWEMRTVGIDAEIPPKTDTASTTEETETGTGTVSGFVTDYGGEPIEGATVVIRGTELIATTNKEGYFVISGVPTGSHDVVASAETYEHNLKCNIKVINGLNSNISFRLGLGFKITGIRPDLPDKEGK